MRSYCRCIVVASYFSVFPLFFGAASAALPEAGSITVKPLTIYFTTMTFGYNQPVSKINGIAVNTYRPTTGFAAASTYRNGVGYELEVGVHCAPEFELLAQVGFGTERPIKEVIVKDVNTANYNYAFDFYERKNHHLFLGARYYWDTKSNWNPFVSLVCGCTRQGKAKIKAASGLYLSPPILPNAWGPKTVIQGAKTLGFGGKITVGADFHFNKSWALTLFTGLEYRPTAKKKLLIVDSRTVVFRDNWRRWAIPVGACVKITF